MKTLTYLGCTALSLATVACNSGSNTGGNGPVAGPVGGPPPPSSTTINCSTTTFRKTSDVDALPGGLWHGSLVDCANNTNYDSVIALVSEDGRFRIIDANGHVLAGGLGTTGNVFHGGGTDFAATGIEYFSGPTTSMFVEGTIAERDTWEGRWGTEWGFYGYFTFEYVGGIYERPTTLADLSGVWPLAVNYAGVPHEGAWTVEPDGRFDGQDDNGCLQSGQFSVVDERYSLFAVDVSVTGCDLAGSYTGLALYEDLVDLWEKSVTVSVDDGARVMRIGLAISQP